MRSFLLILAIIFPSLIFAQMLSQSYIGTSYNMPSLFGPKTNYITTCGPSSGNFLFFGIKKCKWNYQIGTLITTIKTLKTEDEPYRDSFVKGKTTFLSFPVDIKYNFVNMNSFQIGFKFGFSFFNPVIKSHFEMYNRINKKFISGKLYFRIPLTISVGLEVSKHISKCLSFYSMINLLNIYNYPQNFNNSFSHSQPPIETVFNIDNLYLGAGFGLKYHFKTRK